MGSARRATPPPPSGSRAGEEWPFLKAQDQAVDFDGVGVIAMRPREVRKGVGGWAMQHCSVEVETRAMARAIERLGVGVQRDRASQVGAIDREDVQLSLQV